MTPLFCGPWARRIVVFLGCCLLFLAVAVPVSAYDGPSQAQRQVTVGIPESIPPYYLLDEDGNPSGFAIAVMNEVAKRAGLMVTYRVKKNWGEILKALRSGDIDIVPSLGITERRKEHALFTVPLETYCISLFIRANTRDVNSLGDLSGRPVAVVATNAARRILKSRDDIVLRVFGNFYDALFSLLSGHVEAFAYPEPVTWKLAREAGVSEQIKIAGEPLKEIKRGMAVPKDRVELLTVLDRAVRDFVASPEYRSIYVAWFGKPDPYWTVARVFWAMGGIMAVLIISMAWWRNRAGVRMIRALQKKDERLSGAIESLQEGFVLFDKDDRLVMANDVYRRINPKADEFLEKSMRFEDLIRANVESGRIAEALGREEAFICERLEQHRDSRDSILRQFNDGKCYVIQETRTPEGGTAVTFTDITTLKAAEEALKESETRLQAVFDNTPVCLNLKDTEGRYLLLNKPYEEWLGRPAEEIIGKKASEFLENAVEVENLAAAEKIVLETGEAFEREISVPRPDGNVLHRILIKFPVKSADGTISAIGTVALDITERKRAEEKLRKLSRAVEQSPASILITDTDGTIEYVNPKFTEITGYSSEEAMGQNPSMLKSGETPKAVYERLWAAIKSGKEWRGTLSNKRKDGTVYLAGVSISLIVAPDGAVTHFIGALQDITQKVEDERRLKQTEKMESLGGLAGGIAHDFNNMLLPILSLTDMTRKSLPEDSRDRLRLEKVVEAATRAKDLVARILAFSRREDAVRENIDIHAAIRETMDLLHSTLPTTVKIKQRLRRDTGTVFADRAQMISVLLNLATNAADAMDGKTGEMTVSLLPLKVSRKKAVSIPDLDEGKYAKLAVKDNGHGMDEETLARVMDPFFTTKPVGEGTGLGLSMVHGIVSKHGGAVHIMTTPGEGTTVEVYLPLVDGEADHESRDGDDVSGDVRKSAGSSH